MAPTRTLRALRADASSTQRRHWQRRRAAACFAASLAMPIMARCSLTPVCSERQSSLRAACLLTASSASASAACASDSLARDQAASSVSRILSASAYLPTMRCEHAV